MIVSGRVVRIFDDEKIAINLGTQEGLKKGQRVFIYAPEIDIHDPETGENLGAYRHLKVSARVDRLSKRFSIVGPYPERVPTIPPASRFLGVGVGGSASRSTPGELPINSMDAEPIPTGNEIRVGDTVIAEIEADEAPASAEAGAETKTEAISEDGAD